MFMPILKKSSAVAVAVTLAAGAMVAPTKADAADVTIGWTAWSDAEAVTRLAAKLIEDNYGKSVEMQLADIAIQYQGIANGDLDFMMMSWLPETHADYYERFAGQVVDVGPIYTNAKLGWAVPTYIPEDQLSSIEDLKKDEVRQRLNGQIQGIDPGAGLMRLSQKAIEEDYNLDYELISASGAAMTAALERAIRRDEWIVVTTWSPHWMFGKWDLRYLEDPEGSLGGAERIHVIARKDFDREQPEVFDFLSRFYIPLEELQAIMAEGEETSYDEAVANYIENNPQRVKYWVTGEL